MKNPLLWLALFSLTLFGCSSTQHYNQGAPESRAMMASADMSSPGGSDRLVARSATMTLAVTDPEATNERVTRVVSDAQGWINNSHSHQERIYITLEVPDTGLNAFLDEVASLGEVTARSINARDVTEQVVDTQAQLDNLLALRERYRQLLDRADTVKDMLEIERQLAQVQSQIDMYENRRKHLDRQVDYAQVSLTLEQRRVYGPLGVVVRGVYRGVRKLFIWN
ncbi:DUF4349 domain-containing protein [Marinimicrobium alkaliphilum]|uniref:DUF4349 domain-containing protein n=1 Tax=Marinimicrobium alkaliphilum TaxID=2202654 RepID=UPI001300B9F5|nr:DUF4349 domain-containing protein [Marinimicrobium alkaliphilum]